MQVGGGVQQEETKQSNFIFVGFNLLSSDLHAGVWATKLGQMAGVRVPLVAMHHAYVVTERIEGIQVCVVCPPLKLPPIKAAPH